MYRFYPHSATSLQCSYFNSYGLEGYGTTITPRTGVTIASNISFHPQQGVICTGQMAESISHFAKEFTDNQCIPLSTLREKGFTSTETYPCLPRFTSVKKDYSIILNTFFETSGTVGNMKYIFSGDSTSFTTALTPAFPTGSAVDDCYWQAQITDFLGATYSNTDLGKSVKVTIEGAVTATSYGWYYKVVASDRTVIKSTSRLSSNKTFTTTMDKLDGAVVFFSKSSNITTSYWTGAEKATDGVHNITSTTYYYSWK